LSLEPIQTRNLRDYNTTTTTSPSLKRVDFSTSFRYLSGPKKCTAFKNGIVLCGVGCVLGNLFFLDRMKKKAEEKMERAL
jgi:hypothetical protein